MQHRASARRTPTWPALLLAACLAPGLLQAQRTVTLTVEGPAGQNVGPYRWLVEEDRTYNGDATKSANPNNPAQRPQAVNFYTSYMPVVTKGEVNGTPAPKTANISLTDPQAAAKRYFVSVMPKTPGAWTIGGTAIPAGVNSIKVILNKTPLPTAQISVFVFEDKYPINNSPDLPAEQGLAGFQVILEDGGGRYGAAAGQQTKDAWGNPLGTTYWTCAEPAQPGKAGCDIPGQATGNYQVDAEGLPIVKVEGSGVLLSGPCPGPECGLVTIKNLSQGKYGVSIVPPVGQGWQQTNTIEGTKIIDAWVKPGEPAYFKELGPPGFHTWFGFVKSFTDTAVLSPSNPVKQTLSGRVVNMHMSRPPDYAFYNGAPINWTTPWVGLNDQAGAAAGSKGLYAAPVDANGGFSIPNVPPGQYQLVVWDSNLDLIFAFHTVTVSATGCSGPSGSCNFGDVPVFTWFTRIHNHIFSDDGCAGKPEYNPAWAEDGYRQACENPIKDLNINLRWRDGTVNQFMTTDTEGVAPFDEVFPFFAWQVAEVDFSRLKATGVTVTVDNGGPINPLEPRSFEGQLNPQPQCQPGVFYDPATGTCPAGQELVNPLSGDNLSRTEQGPVLLQGYQGFIGQLSVFEWGKAGYQPGENGGISGVVYYSTTRAEDDPAMGAPEVWEPGIPSVTVRLWDTTQTKLLAVTQTDSWDASQPAGCQGQLFTFAGQGTDCYDGLRNFNQARPAVFDGGYAFTTCQTLPANPAQCVAMGTAGAVETPLPTARYVVEVIPPTGYEIVKEEDRNVDFGDSYIPSPGYLPAACVGGPHLVPAELSLFPGVPAKFAGQTRPLCDRREVFLNDGANAAADFFLFTEVPVAGHIYGMILDDLSNEFDPASPNFGEKYAPPFLPVSLRDHTGREINRVYADQYGIFSLLVPSTFTANAPKPSGMDPNMLTACMNARTRADGTQDPFFNPKYSEFCYTLQYMPGTTTHLDTPVVPVAAYAGPNQFPVDCEQPTGSPRIKQVTVAANGKGGGPWASAAGQVVTITAVGSVRVPNPNYCPGPPMDSSCNIIDTNLTVLRDYGFGSFAPGVSKVTLNGAPLTIVGANPNNPSGWRPTQIQAIVPAGVSAGQLLVTRANPNTTPVSGVTTVAGVTLTVGGPASAVRTVSAGQSIQAAIDAANPGDLILVGPGKYSEMVIMDKPVRLQGWGEGVTTIDANPWPSEKIQNWRALLATKLPNIDLAPGQTAAPAQFLEPGTLQNEEGAGVLVLGRVAAYTANHARIDGFTITGSDTGGGVVVNGNTPNVEISNNRITNNYGMLAGGVRIGHPNLLDGTAYSDAQNDNASVHNNFILMNGGLGGAGGGVAVCTGADNYQVAGNFICGNYSLGDGGGVAHLGRSNNGVIANNTVLFNEVFNQGAPASGGGLFVGGEAPVAPAATLSPGAGSVTVTGNLIQGNSAGAGDGGGIVVSRFNGQDVTAAPSNPDAWYKLEIFNNMIVNNVAALAGGGVSLADAARTLILHNTIANNDSTATAMLAFTPGNPNQSNPQPAGIASYAHTAALANAVQGAGAPFNRPFADPDLRNNIVRHNRSFYFWGDPEAAPPLYLLLPDVDSAQPPVYWDLGVLGTASPQRLSPEYCALTTRDVYGLAGQQYSASNVTGDPRFVREYLNGNRGVTIQMPETTTAIQAPAAFDEGGNFIRLRFGPLSATVLQGGRAVFRGDYHLGTGSSAINFGSSAVVGASPLLTQDYDLETRPAGAAPDIGADEIQQ